MAQRPENFSAYTNGGRRLYYKHGGDKNARRCAVSGALSKEEVARLDKARGTTTRSRFITEAVLEQVERFEATQRIPAKPATKKAAKKAAKKKPAQ